MEKIILCNKKNIILGKHIVINRMIFSDGEKYLNITGSLDSTKKIVLLFIMGDEKSNDMLVELILILDILRRGRCGVVLFIPYLFYARQERWVSRCGSVGLRCLLYLIRTMGARKIFTIDIHKLVNCRFLYNVSLAPILRKIILEKHRKCRIVFPDCGSYKRYGKIFHKEAIATLSKYRKGKALYITTNEKFSKRDCVCVVDDIVDSGRTLKEVYNLLRRKTRYVYFYTVHGVFSSEDHVKYLNIKSFNTLFRRRVVTGNRFFYSKSIITKITKVL